jgi:cysteine-rich repeat protein
MSISARLVLLPLILAACSDDSGGGGASASASGTGTTGSTGVPTTTATTEAPPTGTASATEGQTDCTPGQVEGCLCDGAGTGEQVCGDDGQWGPCVCPDPCGDGEVDAGEVCDDGVNDGSYGGCAPGCDAFGPSCGDGVVGGPEACDDGNDIDGDGCNVDCVISGSEVWTRGYAGEDAGNARARGVAVDGAGNVIIVGEEFVVGQNANIWARKYTPDGDVLWSYTWIGADNGDDVAHAVAIAPGDDLVITGETYVSGSGADIWIARLDGGMQEKWITTHNGPGNLGDRGFGVAVDDGTGDIVVTGEEYKLIGLHNVWTRRLDGDGNALWTDVFDANVGNDSGRAVAIADDGDIVVAGDIYVPVGLANTWLRRYTADGMTLWSRDVDHMLGNDRAHGVAIGPDGTIGVVGEVYEVAGLSAIHVTTWSADGDLLWTQIQDSDGGDNDIGHGAAIDGQGNLIAVGEEYTANDFARVFARKYDPAQTELWTQIFDGDAAGNDIAWAVATSPEGYVYVAGEEYNVGQFADVWLRKYAP